MKTFSQDLRERVVTAYEAGEGSYAELAERFVVSPAWVGKLVRQFRELGTLEPLTHRRGRKRIITGERETQLLEHLRQHPDATLEERIEALGLVCRISTLWNALRRLDHRFKKSR